MSAMRNGPTEAMVQAWGARLTGVPVPESGGAGGVCERGLINEVVESIVHPPKTRRRAKSTVRKTLTRRGENPRVQHTQVVLPGLKSSHVAQLPSSRPVTFAFGCVQRLAVLAQRGMKGAVRGVTIDIVPPARDHPRSVQGGERIRRSMYIRVFTESA